jgi:hypothetical protein
VDLSTAHPDAAARSGPAGFALREVANKLEAYWRVRASRRPPPTPPGRWGELVEVASRGAPYAALFRLERLGHHLAETAWRVAGGRPRGLFTDPARPALPAHALIPLHVGLGLAFADCLLRPLPRRVAAGELAGVLARLLASCRDNARPGYLAAAWEAVGVYVVLFRERWVATAGRLVCEIDRDAGGCFWHGAGRGVYFLPRHLAPASTERGLALCRRQPADEESRADALAGFVFAAVMVNLRHPPVLERVLARAAACASTTALIPDAVGASVLVRREVTPHDPAIAALLAHRPARPQPWQRWVCEPVLRALADEAPLQLASRHLTGFARHRPAGPGAAGHRAAGPFANMSPACVPFAASAASPSSRSTTR